MSKDLFEFEHHFNHLADMTVEQEKLHIKAAELLTSFPGGFW